MCAYGEGLDAGAFLLKIVEPVLKLLFADVGIFPDDDLIFNREFCAVGDFIAGVVDPDGFMMTMAGEEEQQHGHAKQGSPVPAVRSSSSARYHRLMFRTFVARQPLPG